MILTQTSQWVQTYMPLLLAWLLTSPKESRPTEDQVCCASIYGTKWYFCKALILDHQIRGRKHVRACLFKILSPSFSTVESESEMGKAWLGRERGKPSRVRPPFSTHTACVFFLRRAAAPFYLQHGFLAFPALNLPLKNPHALAH